MTDPLPEPSTDRRLAIAVRGVVQGVGFRPFVYHAARTRGLTGWVQNEADLVRIEVQGDQAALDAFLDALRHTHPPQARIDRIDAAQVPCEDQREPEFSIRASGGQAAPRPTVPADLATCAECLAEIRTPGERRYHYPFTNCTNCGPRWSIIRELPYDRPRTSMARFAMCRDCEAEYRDPADRRFHAQPIACPACGPALELLNARGRRLATRQEALERAARAVCEGQVLALKGLGGFQFVVDATNPDAVARLRRRKQRPAKPLAVMLSSLEEAQKRCQVSEAEGRALTSHQAPILLLWRRTEKPLVNDVAEAVAPGNPYLGVMLPYTPLHHLLLAAIRRPIVCTSGNLSEEPMAIASEEALARLGSIADVFLVHDRPIVRPVDDSVARVGPEGLEVLRRARGFAPLPIDLGRSGPTVLAVGGHLKNTVALLLGSQAVLSPHVGDLDNVLGAEVHQRAIADLVEFFRAAPDVVACDLHPDYASTRHAETLAARWGVPLVRVQHHHAHVAACMAEHRLEGPVLGFSWDGTGYGPDGTVWGGEVLECDGAGFRRVAHLRTFPLPGGDRAVREPRRSALGLLFETMGEQARQYAEAWFAPTELETLLAMLSRPGLCPRTSSMGRLFDAVAAICGLPAVISFEGEAAMALEFAADERGEAAYPVVVSAAPPLLPTGEGGGEGGSPRPAGCVSQANPHPNPLPEGEGTVVLENLLAEGEGTVLLDNPLPEGEGTVALDWEPMVRAILADRAAGATVGKIAGQFHRTLAEMAARVASRWQGGPLVLSGGCFQNAVLARCVRGRLAGMGLRVFSHREVPPNDGGIALGQAWIAARAGKERGPVVPDPPHPLRRRGAAAIIVREGRFLVIRRSDGVVAPRAFCFPGGGIEGEESEEATLAREIREELGTSITPVRRVWRSVTPWGVELAWWLSVLPPDGILAPNPAEVESVHWVTAEEMAQLPGLLESNRAFLSALASGQIVLMT